MVRYLLIVVLEIGVSDIDVTTCEIDDEKPCVFWLSANRQAKQLQDLPERFADDRIRGVSFARARGIRHCIEMGGRGRRW